MMASFMLYFKRISLFIAISFLCLQALASDGSIAVKSADLTLNGESYRLNADLEIDLNEKIEEAINKGVNVTFLYEFSLVKPRTFWFDKKISSASTHISVSYHALSRQYLVSQNGRQTSHEILSEAMIELVQLYDWKVLDKSAVNPDEAYDATLSVKLDQSKLPKAIQVETIGSENWSMVSEPYEWVPRL
jgi:uncharacterized protein DUF4390